MTARGLGRGPAREIRRITGGTQNELIAFRCGCSEYVLRYSLTSADGAPTLREARILEALDGTDVPHPRLHGVEPDPAVIGAAFLVMAHAPGHTLPHNPDGGTAGGTGEQLATELASALAHLGNLRPESIGLVGLGKPLDFLERQVPRWRWQFERYEQVAGYPRDLPGRTRIEEWLERRRPAPQAPGLMHGDMHLSNVMFAGSPLRLSAIVDWELATIGDPLLDLAQLTIGWPRPDGRSLLGDRGSVRAGTILPGADVLLEAYGRVSDRSLADIGWYQVLACYRLAAILEGSLARALSGTEPMPQARAFHQEAAQLLRYAQERIAGTG
jgi:aminoglycoside phosphotransferase (APT) family kinase protein